MSKNDPVNGNLNKLFAEGFVISDDETKYLSAWGTLSMQILEAKESLTLSKKFGDKKTFEKFEEFVLANAMFKNSILSYAKCFSSSGTGKISIDANEIFKNNPTFRTLHNKLMEMRNKYIAHNDNNDFEFAMVLQKKEANEITLSHTVTYETPVADFEKYFKLFDYCTNFIIEQVNKKADKIEKRLGTKIKFN
jgi:hypothetical protein